MWGAMQTHQHEDQLHLARVHQVNELVDLRLTKPDANGGFAKEVGERIAQRGKVDFDEHHLDAGFCAPFRVVSLDEQLELLGES